ncbi:MAG TPA: hypothetical protein VGD78_11005 [Chthoniobacterales bacterium]
MTKPFQSGRGRPASPRRPRTSAPRSNAAPWPWVRNLHRLCRPALAIAALALCAWSVWAYRNYRDDFAPSSNQKTLVFGPEDIDPESTSLLLKLLEDNQADNRVALALVRQEKVSQAVLSELAPVLLQGQVPPLLLPAAENLRKALGTGEANVYTLWVEPGDDDIPGWATLTLDGYPLGRFSVNSGRYALSVLLNRNSSARLRILAGDGNQRPFTFCAETARSEGCTRRLHPGRADELVVLATGN